MRPRAIRDLVQLADPGFFLQVSVGINHLASNGQRLADDAATLERASRHRGFSVLAALLNEEAAKILILLDAVRCPRRPVEILSRQLSRFNDHLAKGIYADAVYWRMPTFQDLMNAVDESRQQYHLDGPSDVDWIFRNRIITEREETLYVDYVDTGEAHHWHVPRDEYFLGPSVPMSWTLGEAFTSLGCASPDSLSAIADIWRPFQLELECTWPQIREMNWRMLNDLDSRGLLLHLPHEEFNAHVRLILDAWQFPMYPLDLKLSAEDNRAKLREIQDAWSPDL